MKQTKILMGMPITLEVIDKASKADFDEIYSYFKYIDNKFSTYKEDSEISLINKGKITREKFSKDMKMVFLLSEITKKQTKGFFNIFHNGKYDPSGLVKGWAIYNAAKILRKKGINNFYVDAGGDIQVFGKNRKKESWKIGIKNPFNNKEIIKVVSLKNVGIATSGTYIRGQHIYDPKNNHEIREIVSLTVIGPNVYEADRFATAAFAMGKRGIEFIESLKGFEGYMIDKDGLATLTSGFENYVQK